MSKLVSVNGVPVREGASEAANRAVAAAIQNLFAALNAAGIEHVNELDEGTRELCRDLRGVLAYGPLMRGVR